MIAAYRLGLSMPVSGVLRKSYTTPTRSLGGIVRLPLGSSPQHSNTRDAATGTPIYSVYGESDAQRRPPAEVVAGLDAVVFDIADIGVRFYTYESTLGYFLEAAAGAGKEMVVLDRPNPLNGAFVEL